MYDTAYSGLSTGLGSYHPLLGKSNNTFEGRTY